MEAIKYNSLDSFNETMRDHVLDSAIVSITDYLGRIEYANDNFCKIL